MVFAKKNHETGFARVESEREAGLVLTEGTNRDHMHAYSFRFFLLLLLTMRFPAIRLVLRS